MTRTTRSLASIAAGLASMAAGRYAMRRTRAIEFAGRTVLITGGSRGLGLVMARQVSLAGAVVALFARDKAELDQASEELTAHGTKVVTTVCDVGDRTAVRHAVGDVIDRLGRIDVLINNAGIIQVGPLEHMSRKDFEEAMEVHFWGAFNMIQAVLPDMFGRSEGRIVNIASIAGELAVPHLAPYVASKFALVGYSNAIRAELTKYGVMVTTVSPGLMRTGSARHAQFKGRHEAEYAWFAALSSLPLMSINAERAAAKIIDACRHGDPHLIITPQARLAALLDGLMPNTMGWAMALGNRLLPAATDRAGDHAQAGADSHPSSLPAFATALGDRAAVMNNELHR